MKEPIHSNEQVISSHTLLDKWLLIHAGIKLHFGSKRVSRWIKMLGNQIWFIYSVQHFLWYVDKILYFWEICFFLYEVINGCYIC